MVVLSSFQHAVGNLSFAGYTTALPVSFNNNLALSRLGFYSYNVATTGQYQARIWSSTGTLLAESALTTITAGATVGAPGWINLSYNFVAGTVYYIGGYHASNTPYQSVAGTVHAEPTVGGHTMTVQLSNTYQGRFTGSNTSTLPASTQQTWEMPFAVDVAIPNVLPNAPTGVSVTNSPVPYGTNPSVSWTHNDPESNAQSKFQIRWRKAD